MHRCCKNTRFPTQKKRFRTRLWVSIFTTIILSAQSAYAWQTVAPGIEYLSLDEKLTLPWSHIHVFRVNLKTNQFELNSAKNIDLPLASVTQLSKKNPLVIALNGGFFDAKNNPLGLRINNGVVTNPYKPISWWGIFSIRKPPASTAMIQAAKQYQYNKNIEFAVQSGPRLIVNYKIPKLKNGIAERSALGITKEGDVVILVTENAAISTENLAFLMKNSPLNCKNAINLDGGSSSQIYAHFPKFTLHASGLAPVSDAIIISPRKN